MEGEYQDCINGGGDNLSDDNLQNQDSDRVIIEFDQAIFDQIRDREIVGYYVFRDDNLIHFGAETFYYDFDVTGGVEYCYSISAVYDNAQSGNSEESCVESYLADFIPGDVNLDEMLDILDVVIMVNMIFGIAEPNYQVADINDDGIINVLDVIIVINSILDA